MGGDSDEIGRRFGRRSVVIRLHQSLTVSITRNQSSSGAIRDSSPLRSTANRGKQRQSELRTFEIDQDWMACDALRERTYIGRVQRRREEERLQPPTCPTDRRQLRNQRQSEAIRGNQRQSELLTCPTDRRQLRMQFEDRVEMSRVEQPVSFVEHEELRGRERGGGMSRERRKRSQSEALRH